MPKIMAVPVAAAAEAKFTLPEPEITFDVDAESGDITVHVKFPNVDPDVNKKSKQTLYLSRTQNPVSVEFDLEGAAQVLAIDSQGRQPLQFRCALSVPFIEEKEQTNGEGSGETSGESGGDPEDEEV